MSRHAHLMKHYGHQLDRLEWTPKGKFNGEVYGVGYDTEYEEIDPGRRNKILSYQVAVFSRQTCIEKVHLTENGRRLTLKQIVTMALREINGGRLPEGKVQVLLIAHFSAAEVAALADRDQVRRSLRVVRKGAITKRMIRLQIGSARVSVQLFDTRLIAPATVQSLEKLGKLLSSPDLEKIVLPEKYKSQMGLLLREDPELFHRYAKRDCWVTLEAFLLLQECLNRLAFGQFRRLFKTLGAASVAGFIERNPGVKEYLAKLRGSAFLEAIGKMKQGFFGGLCSNYFVGETRGFAPTRHHVIVDLDISSAYPVCMKLIPMIDVHAEALILRTRYQITETVAEELRLDGLDEATIASLKRALEEDPASFKAEAHRLIRGKKRLKQILAKTAVVDNQLVEKWALHARSGDDAFGVSVDRYVILGCAYVRFEFPEGVMNPCLAISHSKYGLQYVRQGEALATSAEIVTAMEAGARIEALFSAEFPLKRDEAGGPEFLLGGYLDHLVTERGKHAKGTVMNLLYKEAVNSLYGKLGQSVNRRRVTEISTGESRELGPSPITEPVTAAMTTGIARAALSGINLAVERFNEGRPESEKIYAISATTDGVLLALPASPGFSVADEFYREKDGRMKFSEPPVQTVLARFGCEGLLVEMKRFSVLRQLACSSKALVGGHHFLEVKHVADHAVGIKSRGQIGFLSDGRVSIIAKCGHRPPRPDAATGEGIQRAEGEWLHLMVKKGRTDGASVTTYATETLPSLGKILKPGGPQDMVMTTQEKRVNVDYDYKRRLVAGAEGGISPITVPHQTFSHMLQHRRVMERIRKRGECATPEKVHHELQNKGKTTRLLHGDAGAIARGVLRGALQGHFGEPLVGSYAEISAEVSTVWRAQGHAQTHKKAFWTRDDVKNATRGEFEPGIVLPTAANVRLIDGLCQALGLDATRVHTVLFSRAALDEVLDRAVEQVVLAILHAPKMGLDPFVELHRDGLLPGHQDLVNILYPRVTDLSVLAHARGAFIPGKLAERDHGQLVRIFSWFGIPKDQGHAAARVIAPTVFREQGGGSAVPDRLLDEFVMAALDQSVMAPAPVPSPAELLNKLRFFGLTVKRFKRLRSSRLNPNSLANTPANRQQVKRMAKALELSADPFLATLLGGRS